MATSNPASIPMFAEIERQEILLEAQRERLAMEAARGRDPGGEDLELGTAAVPVAAVTGLGVARAWAAVLGRLGRRAAALGRT